MDTSVAGGQILLGSVRCSNKIRPFECKFSVECFTVLASLKMELLHAGLPMNFGQRRLPTGDGFIMVDAGTWHSVAWLNGTTDTLGPMIRDSVISQTESTFHPSPRAGHTTLDDLSIQARITARRI